jgi:excinuclease ABC subunit C
MEIADTVRAKLAELPEVPGVYLMRDVQGRIIYVGKAINLKDRVTSYFRDYSFETTTPLRRDLVRTVTDIEWYRARSEAEALLLESKLIKDFKPRFNIALRDDKRYMMIRIHLEHPFPRFDICRFRRQDGYAYFGPYVSATSAREAVDFAERRFGIRVCLPLRPGAVDFKHCLSEVIRQCSAPCMGRISQADYQARVSQACAFLRGESPELIEEVRASMIEAAQGCDYERAASLRDTLAHLETAIRQRRLLTGDPGIRAKVAHEGVDVLQTVLRLARRPNLIECIDISTISGSHSVASLVAAVDGVPQKNRYRRYRIRTVEGMNDPAMMKEVVSRHLKDIREGSRELPDLLLLDGGQTQLAAAREALAEAGMPNLPTAALAKRFEEIHVEVREPPIRLPTQSPALNVLRSLRDEAHRFAIAYNRMLRARKIRESVLDDIPGIGPSKKKALLSVFGSTRRLSAASEEEIAVVPGIGAALARSIKDWLCPSGLREAGAGPQEAGGDELSSESK